MLFPFASNQGGLDALLIVGLMAAWGLSLPLALLAGLGTCSLVLALALTVTGVRAARHRASDDE